MQRSFLLMLFLILLGCSSDQMMVYEKEVEVPVYIEVEVPVPVDTPAEDVEIWVDSFIQVNAVDGVDIVWVIDQSGSMNVYQPNLLAGLNAMMSALPPTGWRLVMISADPDAAVDEQQFPLVPGDTVLDAEAMYAAMEKGTREKGFDAIHDYMEHNPYAATWMRHDAALLVVFVSDEDDQSDTLQTAAEFVNWYSARRFGNVFLSSIVNDFQDVSLCDPWAPGSQVGQTYMDATNLMFGTNVDICSEDWAPGMNDATTQIEPYESIELSYEPIPQTIRVFVDSLPYTDWTYDTASNIVYFDVLPPGGALVEIGYVLKE